MVDFNSATGFADGGPVLVRRAGQSIRSGLAALRDQFGVKPHVILPQDDPSLVHAITDDPLAESRELMHTYSSSPKNPRMAHPHDRNALSVLKAAQEDFDNAHMAGGDVPVWGRFYTMPVPLHPKTRMPGDVPHSADALMGGITAAPSWANDEAMEILHAGSMVPGLGRQMLHEMRAMPHMRGRDIVLDMLDSPHTAQFYQSMGFEPAARLLSERPEYHHNLRLDPDEISGYKGRGGDYSYDWFLPGDKPFARAEGGAVRKSWRRFAKGGAVRGTPDPDPTDGQKQAGNYRKAHLKVHGMDVALEHLRGGTRSGKDRNGKPWSVKMPAHYGYIKRTKGADKDHVDVYLGLNHDYPMVHVINQHDANTGKFDEHKVMMGYRSKAHALADYDKAFTDGKGPQRRKSVRTMHVDHFKHWLAKGDTKKPVPLPKAA